MDNNLMNKVNEVKDNMMNAMKGTKDDNSSMSMDKVKEVFSKDLDEEIADSNKYMDMAMFADQIGEKKLAKGLMDMSKDEYTHAKFIHYNLVNWGIPIQTDTLMKWTELKERLKQML